MLDMGNPLATFGSFEEAADYVDQQTTPANAGSFLIEQTAADEYTVYHLSNNLRMKEN